MLDKLKNLPKQEPAVAVATALALVQAVWAEASVGLDAGAGWRAVLTAVAGVVIRQLVVPKEKAEKAQDWAYIKGAAAGQVVGLDPRK